MWRETVSVHGYNAPVFHELASHNASVKAETVPLTNHLGNCVERDTRFGNGDLGSKSGMCTHNLLTGTTCSQTSLGNQHMVSEARHRRCADEACPTESTNR
ncbi:unnamed protein product [Mesocestoides corti]|uniref:Uncharacterized protein n=1 Tax=Mesocestoides corti TaxID=53468 RepID=A0A0R3UFV0_MESCO|nr:unnamed protein product [Mesocestoides corti]